ncbi:hypothetical protein MMC10_005783 [Thelotrema lepadinum]|nr:hypothetical protein [Thelotrema lepadinum]
MPKRKARSLSGSDSDESKETPRKRATTTPKSTPALYLAKVKRNAAITSLPPGVDMETIEKIQKCFDRGDYPNTRGAEKITSIRMGNHELAKYNLTKELVRSIASQNHDTQKHDVSQSVVSIARQDGDKSKPVKRQSYLKNLCDALGCSFDCTSSFKTKGRFLEVKFSGTREKTVAAALALELLYNMVTERSRGYKGLGGKNSFAVGATDYLVVLAGKNKALEDGFAMTTEEAELQANIKQEKAARIARLLHLAARHENASASASKYESDDTSDDDDFFEDEEQENMLDPAKKAAKTDSEKNTMHGTPAYKRRSQRNITTNTVHDPMAYGKGKAAGQIINQCFTLD